MSGQYPIPIPILPGCRGQYPIPIPIPVQGSIPQYQYQVLLTSDTPLQEFGENFSSVWLTTENFLSAWLTMVEQMLHSPFGCSCLIVKELLCALSF